MTVNIIEWGKNLVEKWIGCVEEWHEEDFLFNFYVAGSKQKVKKDIYWDRYCQKPRPNPITLRMNILLYGKGYYDLARLTPDIFLSDDGVYQVILTDSSGFVHERWDQVRSLNYD